MAATSTQTMNVVSIDCPQVDLLKLHQLDAARYPFLLESVAQGQLGRFDVLFAFPQDTLTLSDATDARRSKMRSTTPINHSKFRTSIRTYPLPAAGSVISAMITLRSLNRR